jgi:hypothetical protein
LDGTNVVLFESENTLTDETWPAVVSEMSHAMDRTIEKLRSSIPSRLSEPSR